jgi:multiple sugar transport system substrate-binding protein
MKLGTLVTAAAVSVAGLFATSPAQSQEITLCWAAWDPANALVELSKEFEAESGIKMSFEFVP